ncbi:MAG: protein kinase domain-containing protein [Kofleriaceae bacterium]
MNVGSTIGAYRVLKQLGEGGMGSVWLAEHTMLGRRAAIKVLHTEFSSRPEFVQRFFNEARAATAIEDPGIVQIFDFGQHTDGSAYIVMELLDGEAVDKRLQRQGTLDVPSALRLMRQIASTLGAAHNRGIVHRDLKPENLFIVRDPEVNGGERAKVLDFGIAKLTADSANKVRTQTSAVMGTPTYMSPEQCRGAGHVDQRSDVYALGCVLFHMLVGRPPFVSEGIGDLIVMHMTTEPPVPSTMRHGGLPREIDQVILRCLAKNPAQRFASGSELAMALGALTGSSPMIGGFPSHPHMAPQAGFHSQPYPQPGQPGTYPPPGTNPHGVPTTLSLGASALSLAQPSKKSNGLIFGVAGVLVVGGVVAVILATRGGGKTPDAPVAANEPATPTVTAPATAPEPAKPVEPATTRPPDPNAEVSTRMKTVLSAFTTWATSHADAPCPDVTTLGVTETDPWKNAFVITCTDQPGDQIIGVLSSGPDGTTGNADDVASWRLGGEVTDLVRGARWKPQAKPTIATKKSDKPDKPKKDKPTKPTSRVELDENGLPISR